MVTLTSLSYLLFVVAAWVSSRIVPGRRARQALLLAASYTFYATWGLGFLAILVVSTTVNYAVGTFLRRRPIAARLWVGIGFNVLLLCTFKYIPTLAHTSGGLLARIVMPVGISFWTFQALSYLLDLYREQEIDPSPLEFALYLAFWPTVLSGPVARLGDLLPRLRNLLASWDDIAAGVKRIMLGLFLKLVLAQIMASGLQAGGGVNAGFDQLARGWSALDVWALALGYGFQLYFDFAGYSHIAIGVARLFGVQVPENFSDPYLSRTPSEFWTRWHMSVSFWIRDYVFLPLAVAGRRPWWKLVALFLSMVIFGAWHGASALFLIWGAYHGALLIGHRLVQQWTRRAEYARFGMAHAIVSWAVTLPLISLGWILFRANSLGQAAAMLRAVVTPAAYRTMALQFNFYVITAAVVAAYFLVAGVRLIASKLGGSWNRLGWALSPVMYAAALVLIIIWSGQESLFVYVQF